MHIDNTSGHTTHASLQYNTSRYDLGRGVAHTIKETKQEEIAAWNDEQTGSQEVHRKKGIFNVSLEDINTSS